MRLAVIVLNRNLPEVTDKLCENLISGGLNPESLFVIEAGSDDGKISRFCTWHIRDEETKKNGLRYIHMTEQNICMQLLVLFKKTHAYFLC